MRIAVICVSLLLANAAMAQDMPLSQVLIDGEEWKEVAKDEKAPMLTEGRLTASSPAGKRYRIDPERKAVFFAGRKEPVATDIGDPAGLVFWKDGGTLVVGDSAGKHLHTFRVKDDGTLDAKERYYTLRTRPKEPSGVKALTIDDAGRLYAATNLGVQVFDPTGRMSGVLNSPLREPVTALAFAGEKRDHLYILCGGKLWQRKTKAKAAWPPAPK